MLRVSRNDLHVITGLVPVIPSRVIRCIPGRSAAKGIHSRSMCQWIPFPRSARGDDTHTTLTPVLPARGRKQAASKLMLRLVISRLVSLAVTLLCVSLAIFLILEVLPGDPAAIMLGTAAREDTLAALAPGARARSAGARALPALDRRHPPGRSRHVDHLQDAGLDARRRAPRRDAAAEPVSPS